VSGLLENFTAAGASAPPEAERPEWENALAQACASGRAEHPRLAIDDAVFVRHLARCGASVWEGGAFIYAADLYLACACLQGDATALTILRDTGRPVLLRYLSRVQGSTALMDEIEQRLWDTLLLGDSPRLASYAGRGPLGAWIGITAQRLALMELRHERAEHRARREVAVQDRVLADSPELGAIKRRFKEQFQRAVNGALETLDDRQRLLFRMHLVEGVTLDAIARVYKVHPVTVGRWITVARQQVLDEAKRRLKEELRLESSDFDSLARLLVSGIDLDISNAMKSR
jgi:RNA polymerase sigma-70 factor (ECF subfamily)